VADLFLAQDALPNTHKQDLKAEEMKGFGSQWTVRTTEGRKKRRIRIQVLAVFQAHKFPH
jgi:hypothetical protein